jgi:hypothetical protein
MGDLESVLRPRSLASHPPHSRFSDRRFVHGRFNGVLYSDSQMLRSSALNDAVVLMLARILRHLTCDGKAIWMHQWK